MGLATNIRPCLAQQLLNHIDGKQFVLLQPGEVMKMIPSLGIAKKIIRLIPQNVKQSVSWHESSPVMLVIFLAIPLDVEGVVR